MLSKLSNLQLDQGVGNTRTGGPGFDSRGWVIPKTLKMVVMASFLGTHKLGVNITSDLTVSG